MELCIPVTDIFRRNSDVLLPFVGAVSFKNPSGEVFQGKAHFLESSLNIADPLFPEQMRRIGYIESLQSGRFASFSCDIGPACISVSIQKSSNGYSRYVPVTEPISEGVYLSHAEQNVAFLRSIFLGKIKAENLNYFPSGAYEMVCAPDFLGRLLRRLEVELLLDIGHVVVSAANLEIPTQDYLDRLPLELVSEIQLSGARLIDGVWEDAHELPLDRDDEAVSHVLGCADIEYLTLEYYRDDGLLISEYRRLFNKIRA